jgi:hypothetical protein
VVVTTREAKFSKYAATSIELPLLDLEEGGNMFLHYFRNEQIENTPEEGLAQELASLVEGLPVSVGLCAKYIVSARRPIREAEELAAIFEAELNETMTQKSDDGHTRDRKSRALGYEQTLNVVCDFFKKELPRHSRDLVNILAYFSSDTIPEKMLWTKHDDEELKFLDPSIPFKYVLPAWF